MPQQYNGDNLEKVYTLRGIHRVLYYGLGFFFHYVIHPRCHAIKKINKLLSNSFLNYIFSTSSYLPILFTQMHLECTTHAFRPNVCL